MPTPLGHPAYAETSLCAEVGQVLPYLLTPSLGSSGGRLGNRSIHDPSRPKEGTWLQARISWGWWGWDTCDHLYSSPMAVAWPEGSRSSGWWAT